MKLNATMVMVMLVWHSDSVCAAVAHSPKSAHCSATSSHLSVISTGIKSLGTKSARTYSLYELPLDVLRHIRELVGKSDMQELIPYPLSTALATRLDKNKEPAEPLFSEMKAIDKERTSDSSGSFIEIVTQDQSDSGDYEIVVHKAGRPIKWAKFMQDVHIKKAYFAFNDSVIIVEYQQKGRRAPDWCVLNCATMLPYLFFTKKTAAHTVTFFEDPASEKKGGVWGTPVCQQGSYIISEMRLPRNKNEWDDYTIIADCVTKKVLIFKNLIHTELPRALYQLPHNPSCWMVINRGCVSFIDRATGKKIAGACLPQSSFPIGFVDSKTLENIPAIEQHSTEEQRKQAILITVGARTALLMGAALPELTYLVMEGPLVSSNVQSDTKKMCEMRLAQGFDAIFMNKFVRRYPVTQAEYLRLYNEQIRKA